MTFPSLPLSRLLLTVLLYPAFGLSLDVAPPLVVGPDSSMTPHDNQAARISGGAIIGQSNGFGGLSVRGEHLGGNNSQIELGFRDGSRASYSYLDFHNGNNTDYATRLIRGPNGNGYFGFINRNTDPNSLWAPFYFYTENAIQSVVVIQASTGQNSHPHEGAELVLGGAGPNSAVHMDNFSGRLRFLSSGGTMLDVSNQQIVVHSTALLIGADPGGTGKLRIGGGADVKGTVRAQAVTVTMNGWADHVFDNAPTLDVLESDAAFIDKHKHLPGIPSQADIIKDGLDTGDMLRRHMERIEVLTVHAISLKRERDRLLAASSEQQRLIAHQREEMDTVKAQIRELQLVIGRISSAATSSMTVQR